MLPQLCMSFPWLKPATTSLPKRITEFVVALARVRFPLHGILPGIHRQVCELVGFGILFSTDVTDREPGNQRFPTHCGIIEQPDTFVVDAVLTVHLLHDQ